MDFNKLLDKITKIGCKIHLDTTTLYAGVAELVDAGDSKSPVLRDIRVQFPSPAILILQSACLAFTTKEVYIGYK